MPSQAYHRFIASMTITQDMWRDGLGYDLEALDACTPDERAMIETLLRTGRDWRDAEALARLTPPAAGALLAQFNDESLPLTTRLRAGQELDRLRPPTIPPVDFTPLVLDMLEAGLDDPSVFSRVSDFIECRHPGNDDRVRRAILRHLSRTCAPLATNLAALACVVYGLAPSTHDWTLRPLWLRFQDPRQHGAALDELLVRLGVERRDIRA